MCIIVAKNKGTKFDLGKIKYALESNKDGWGLMYHDGHKVITLKGLSYVDDKVEGFLKVLTDFNAVLHLRYTTVGETTIENCHPFSIGRGSYMMHNGTINSFKPKGDCGTSDSLQLAESLKSIQKFSKVSILNTKGTISMLKAIAGDYINRLVFMDSTGQIKIINKGLGETVDNIWYSNDYFKKKRYKPSKTTSTNYDYLFDDDEEDDTLVDERGFKIGKTYFKDYIKCNKVFVYGTLKKGFSNHRLLEKATFEAAATSEENLILYGSTYVFPYCAGKCDKTGKNIKGEVYTVNNFGEFASLDRLEGYPSLYTREIKKFRGSDGKIHKAWIYIQATEYGDTPKERLVEWVGKKYKEAV